MILNPKKKEVAIVYPSFRLQSQVLADSDEARPPKRFFCVRRLSPFVKLNVHCGGRRRKWTRARRTTVEKSWSKKQPSQHGMFFFWNSIVSPDSPPPPTSLHLGRTPKVNKKTKSSEIGKKKSLASPCDGDILPGFYLISSARLRVLLSGSRGISLDIQKIHSNSEDGSKMDNFHVQIPRSCSG